MDGPMRGQRQKARRLKQQRIGRLGENRHFCSSSGNRLEMAKQTTVPPQEGVPGLPATPAPHPFCRFWVSVMATPLPSEVEEFGAV